MAIRLHDTLTGSLQELAPTDNTVRMYVCGPTVYDRFHIGNARPFIVFDTLRSYLESRGLHVIYVQNITDVDDKIIARAKEEGRSAAEVAEMYTEAYREDCALLGIRPPTHAPRATEYVAQMADLARKLVEKGHAYESGGDVYFSVASLPDYGKLSGRVLEDLEAGARIAVGDVKRDPLDFALWKAAKPGEPSWPSPWGPGRPGWHTECVAMVRELLGETIEIHAGGNDLVFPHHENELAQAEALSGKPFATIWLHNGLLTVRGQRMGKSLGNFAYARDVVERHGGEAVRHFYLTRDWRKPLDFSHEGIEESKRSTQRVYDFLWTAERAPKQTASQGLLEELESAEQRFHTALEDNFSTPTAIGVLHEMVALGHRAGEGTGLVAAAIRRLAAPLGLFQAEAPTTERLSEELIRLIIDIRAELRSARRFDLADSVRDRLAELGIELRDGPEGTTWMERGTG